MTKTRILVVDDSPLIRQVLVDMLEKEADIEIVGQAKNGEEAVALANDLRPDLITLDLEMPKVDGISALTQIMQASPTRVIMVSTRTSAGAEATIEALDKGALDFVCKPRSGSFMALREVQQELLAKIRSARTAVIQTKSRPPVRAADLGRGSDRTVVIATSTGGPKALTTLFETLPKDWAVPVAIVQHMPIGFTASLAARLDKIGAMEVREARDGDQMKPGLALVAPGGSHMRLADSKTIELFDGPSIHGVKPAADHLFNSAAQHIGKKCVGAVLTGMGRDGAAGALAIKEAGGVVLGEAASTCTIYGMPRAAFELGAITSEYPIYEIGHALAATAAGRLKNAA